MQKAADQDNHSTGGSLPAAIVADNVEVVEARNTGICNVCLVDGVGRQALPATHVFFKRSAGAGAVQAATRIYIFNFLSLTP